MDLAKELGLQTEKKTRRESTQEYVPVKDITNGVVITTDGRYIKILEILPTNYMMKTKEEQLAILRTYNAWLKSGPRKFQIKCITRQTKIESYLEVLKEAIEREENPKCKEMALDHMAFLKELGSHGSVERHFFLIFEYEPDNEFLRKEEKSEIIHSIQRMTDTIRVTFAQMGSKVADNLIDDADIAEFLYSFYNRNSQNKFSYESRVNRILKDSCTVNHVDDENLLPAVDVRDLVAPRSIDFTNPEYIIIDGMYCGFFYIRSNGYPLSVSPTGWLSRLISMGNGFDVDIHYQRESTQEMLNNIRTRLKFTSLKYTDRSETSRDKNTIGNSIESMRYLMDALENGQYMYNMCTIITIYAYTLEEYQKKCRFLINEGVKMNIRFGNCNKIQEEGFFSVSPFNKISSKIYHEAHQNVIQSAVAASYPFTNFALADKHGKLLGTHAANSSLVMYDIFDANKYSNANMCIFGESGSGKTYALMSITSRLRYYGIQNFILAPDKQDEFRRICDAVGGTFIDLSPGSPQRINPFEIWPKDSIDNTLINGISYTEKSWLSDKIDNLKMWLQYLIPDLTLAEKVKLEKAMFTMYEKKGITRDNDSIFADQYHKHKKHMPIISDFLSELDGMEEMRSDIPVILSQFVDGAASNINGETNVNLNNKFIVFGLEGLSGELQAPIMFLVLEFVWGLVRANKTQAKMVSIDEGWKLLDPNNPQVADFIIEVFKVIRGFGGGALFATQSIFDLYKDGSNFGNAILSCSHSNIILGMKEKELSYFEHELGLSAAESNDIRTYRRGQELLCAGSTHIPIIIRASKREHLAFTTKRGDLAQIAQLKRKEAAAKSAGRG